MKLKIVKNKLFIQVTVGLLLSFGIYADNKENEELINELNAVETANPIPMDGINQLKDKEFLLTRQRLQEFYAEMNPSNPSPKTMYYPGSGGDVCFPFLLFPTLETVYSFSLESFGDISDIDRDRIDGRLPNQWHIAGASEDDAIYRWTALQRGGANYFKSDIVPSGFDYSDYYYLARDNKICADLLFRIRHVLHGKIISVNKVNDFHNEVVFSIHGKVRKFVHFQSRVFSWDESNYARSTEDLEAFLKFLRCIVSVLPRKIDILFIKGSGGLLRENMPFHTLSLHPFNHLSNVQGNPIFVADTSLSEDIGSDGICDMSMFVDPKKVKTLKTDLRDKGQSIFAFGHNDGMHVGAVTNLK